MKILHTSDWHLGRSLYGRKRYDEFSAFLNWLADVIEQESIDALLVAGDIFDNSTPGNNAQKLYYRFLCKVASSSCRHIVVIAGNHDSPSFLNAPKELLRALNVYVVGSINENPEDEVLTLYNASDIPEAIVCAVPYLRDRDIRTVEAGESVDDKNNKLIDGVKKRYSEVCSIAEQKKKVFQQEKALENVPIIAMGHLFTAGGKTVEGDGVRELYIGTLAHIEAGAFPKCIDYLALGHLHVPQKVGDAEHIRYSGSPIPMGFGEAKQKKSVVIIDFTDKPDIRPFPVPCFQPLERISGGIDDITVKINELKAADSNAWLEIDYTGTEIGGNLRELIDEAVAETKMEIRRVKNKRLVEQVLSRSNAEETLDDLDVNDVFMRCLDTYDVLEDERPELIQSYKEIVKKLQEEDSNEDLEPAL